MPLGISSFLGWGRTTPPPSPPQNQPISAAPTSTSPATAPPNTSPGSTPTNGAAKTQSAPLSSQQAQADAHQAIQNTSSTTLSNNQANSQSTLSQTGLGQQLYQAAKQVVQTGSQMHEALDQDLVPAANATTQPAANDDDRAKVADATEKGIGVLGEFGAVNGEHGEYYFSKLQSALQTLSGLQKGEATQVAKGLFAFSGGKAMIEFTEKVSALIEKGDSDSLIEAGEALSELVQSDGWAQGIAVQAASSAAPHVLNALSYTTPGEIISSTYSGISSGFSYVTGLISSGAEYLPETVTSSLSSASESVSSGLSTVGEQVGGVSGVLSYAGQALHVGVAAKKGYDWWYGQNNVSGLDFAQSAIQATASVGSTALGGPVLATLGAAGVNYVMRNGVTQSLSDAGQGSATIAKFGYSTAAAAASGGYNMLSSAASWGYSMFS